MGVKLDWDIESEKGKHKEFKEDQKQRSTRYAGVFRLVLTVALFAALLGGVAYLILQRSEQVDQYTEQLLIDTVQAEVASLRVGDLTTFEERQRSATADWITEQRETYNRYQTLKSESEIILTGQVLATEIDGQRGRIQVEEIIDGVPYIQTWFYWRYDDGWHHVPPDYTFWGAANEITTDDYIVRYRDVDQQTATQIQQALDRWLVDTCTTIDCATLPLITVDIVPAPETPVRWADNEQNAWQIIVPSPYTDRARADMPFDGQIQIELATLLANRIVSHASNNVQTVPTADATYLRESIISWFVGRFVQINLETYFIQSLVDTYGQSAIADILRNLQPTSSISLVASVASVPTIADLSADWRDFVAWRLNLEDNLIVRNQESAWTSLYDFSNPAVRDSAYGRYTTDFIANTRNVIGASVSTSEAGQPQLIATANVTRGFETGEEIIVFNLINGNWLRAN